MTFSFVKSGFIYNLWKFVIGMSRYKAIAIAIVREASAARLRWSQRSCAYDISDFYYAIILQRKKGTKKKSSKWSKMVPQVHTIQDIAKEAEKALTPVVRRGFKSYISELMWYSYTDCFFCYRILQWRCRRLVYVCCYSSTHLKISFYMYYTVLCQ